MAVGAAARGRARRRGLWEGQASLPAYNRRWRWLAMTEAIAVAAALTVLYVLMTVSALLLVVLDRRWERREPPR